MPDRQLITITAADLEETQAATETAGSPAAHDGRLRQDTGQLGQKPTAAVKQASSRVAQKIIATTTEASNRSAEAIREKVGEAVRAQSQATADALEARLREIDWKSEARKGAECGLHWLIARLEALAQHLRTADKSAEADQTKV